MQDTGTRQPWVRERAGAAEGVVTLTLTQPGRPVVVLDGALLRGIDAALDEIGDDLRGFVLASDSRVFVAGANLEEVMGLDDAGLHRYLEFGSAVFARIAALPCSTVAAINGAALGGGLELAMHCDHLIALRPAPGANGAPGKPYPVGLPEAGLSICPGWGGTNMLPARMDPERAIELTATGKTMSVLEAAEAGLIERLVDRPSDLLHQARDLAARPKPRAAGEQRSIVDADRRQGVVEALARVRVRGRGGGRGGLPATEAARAVVSCVEAGLNGGWAAALARERERLVYLRGTEEGRRAIRAFFEKSGKK